MSPLYPRYTIFIAGIHYRQYLCLITLIYNFYERYRMHDTYYLSVVSMIHILFTSGIHDAQHFYQYSWTMIHNACIHAMDNIYHWISSHQIYLNLIIEETATLVDWSRLRPEICDHDPHIYIYIYVRTAWTSSACQI